MLSSADISCPYTLRFASTFLLSPSSRSGTLDHFQRCNGQCLAGQVRQNDPCHPIQPLAEPSCMAFPWLQLVPSVVALLVLVLFACQQKLTKGAACSTAACCIGLQEGEKPQAWQWIVPLEERRQGFMQVMPQTVMPHRLQPVRALICFKIISLCACALNAKQSA